MTNEFMNDAVSLSAEATFTEAEEKAKRGVLEEGSWFLAETPFGGISLYVPHQSHLKNTSVLASALVLETEERLIQHLEDWLGVGLDFCPAPAASNPEAIVDLSVPASMLEDPEKSEKPPAVRIAFPLRLLLEKGQPDWRQLEVSWSSLQVDLVLGCVVLSKTQLTLLKPRSLVLIPESFQTEWKACVRIEAGKPGRGNTLRHFILNFADLSLKVKAATPAASESHLLLSESAGSEEQGSNIACYVSVKLPIDILLGWAIGQSIILDELRNGKINVALEQNSHLVRIGQGSIVPVIDGCAVLVESLQDELV